MSEPNILMSRVDNRLVHGQVGVTWLSYLGANLLLVADDEVASDKTQQDIMRLTAQQYDAQIRFFTVRHTADIIHKATPSQKIFIITKTPHEMLALIEKGVPIRQVNIGNMHFSEGKRQLGSHAYVDDADVAALRAIRQKVDNLFIQDAPTRPVEKLEL
jgi:PTS system galactosamine-specific IIB component